MKWGIVSVTFRSMSPKEIILLAAKAGAECIEWGGDVHVPDEGAARYVGELTRENGLISAAYGSYYRAGEGMDIDPVLKTASALGTGAVRIWAGKRYSREGEYVNKVRDDIALCVKRAREYGLDISLECHRGTLTENRSTALYLAENTGCLLHFQPNPDIAYEENLLCIKDTAKYIKHVHVFAWEKGKQGDVRLPLEEHTDIWQGYMEGIPEGAYCMIEFVKNDTAEQFLKDGEVLKKLCGKVKI